jgi:hypothetical protein
MAIKNGLTMFIHCQHIIHTTARAKPYAWHLYSARDPRRKRWIWHKDDYLLFPSEESARGPADTNVIVGTDMMEKDLAIWYNCLPSGDPGWATARKSSRSPFCMPPRWMGVSACTTWVHKLCIYLRYRKCVVPDLFHLFVAVVYLSSGAASNLTSHIMLWPHILTLSAFVCAPRYCTMPYCLYFELCVCKP